MRTTRALCFVLIPVLLHVWLVAGIHSQHLAPGEPSVVRARSLPASIAQPLAFEPNRGQADRRVLFLLRSHGSDLLLTGRGASLVVTQSAKIHERHVVSLLPIGMNRQVKVVPEHRLPGVVNYFLGADPSRWHTNIPTYAEVLYDHVYPGIDLRFYRGARGLEYDWLLQPGADPRQIRMQVVGATVSRAPSGGLALRTGKLTIHQNAPISYVTGPQSRHAVGSNYVIRNAHEFGFSVGAHARGSRLVIDPTLVYATYLGGGEEDSGYGLAVDGQGNAYVTGETESVNFPLANPLQGRITSDPSCVDATFHLSQCTDAFVSKLSADGTTLRYSTYLGGRFDDYGHGIAVDGQGNAYVTGNTLSPNFPLRSALQPSYKGGKLLGDAFITELGPLGNVLLFSTYVGGTGDDDGEAIALAAGSVYVSGITGSSDFPVAHAWRATFGGGTCNAGTGGNGPVISEPCSDAFALKLAADGSSLAYSTYIGGSGEDTGTGIAVFNGNAYISGGSASSDFPGVHPLQQYGGGTCGTPEYPEVCHDAFITVLAPGGDKALFSSLLGGSDDDVANDVAVDPAGNIYLTGTTRSANFPLSHPLRSSIPADDQDGFVTKLGPLGGSVIFSTYLGGSDSDDAYGIAADAIGDVYVTGSTLSADFRLKDPIQATIPTILDVTGVALPIQTAYVTVLTPDGQSLIYSTYLGDNSQAGSEEGGSALGGMTLGAHIAVDGQDNAYLTGLTKSDNFPVTRSAAQTTYGGAFVAKINHPIPKPPTPAASPTSAPTNTPVPKKTPTKTPAKKCKKGYKLVHGKCKKVKKR